MGTLGNLYFYIVLLIIVIFLVAITIANSVYFSDAYNGTSENLSTQQSQQLIILNVVTCVLLFVSLVSISYMIFSKSKSKEKLEISNEILLKDENKVDNMITDLNNVRDQQDKKEKTKESMIKLAREMKKPQIELTKENNGLKKEIKMLSNQVKEMTSSISSLQNTNHSLIEEKEQIMEELTSKKKIIDVIDMDENVRHDVIVSEHNKESIFNDGISDISENSGDDSTVYTETEESEEESLSSRSKSSKLSNKLGDMDLEVPTSEHHESIDRIKMANRMELDEKFLPDNLTDTLNSISRQTDHKSGRNGEPSYNYGIDVHLPTPTEGSTYKSFIPFHNQELNKLQNTTPVQNINLSQDFRLNSNKHVDTTSPSTVNSSYIPYQPSFIRNTSKPLRTN